MISLKGMSALVTGAASGLGRATAERLASFGARVVVADLPSSDGEAIAKSLPGGLGVFAPTDVSNHDQVQQAVEVAAEGNGLDILVNCAGVCPASKTLGKRGPHKLEPFQLAMDINVVGTFNMCRLGAQKMAEKSTPGGVIINTASIAAYEGQIGQVAYAASKGAIVGMTLPMARDLSKSNIRVMAIAPGLFDTALLAGLDPKVKGELAATVPVGRLGDPEEFGRLVHAIVDNKMLNGECIRLDGALRMQP